MRWAITSLALIASAPALAQPSTEAFISPPLAGVQAGAVQVGMDYGALRGVLLVAGWEAASDTDCVKGVYGGTGARTPGQENICRDLPEIEACSGDGHCVMYFSNPRTDHRVRITTYGDLRAWEQKNQLSVLGWEQQ
ncbi:hypothetical protein [Altererythrobacter sp. Root672]|uniref:hypothetical protein n=1 Tax=Altererythrobacter sp. Root672 TaxID=1736584 RepID=UPI0006F72253|nr:hypothetical protein [Altererythrobacter sp. Root672]KRA81218.1 hypothetical protein ASD76_11585 [Altererythrobacter sp. Root672]